MNGRTVYDHPVFAPHLLVPPKPLPAAPGKKPPSLGDVLFMPLNEIVKLQVGYLNLLCASSLPDAEGLDILACLRTLEEWTQLVKAETDNYLHRFLRSPATYNNSEAYYRTQMMVTVLQLDCGVRYNPDAIHETNFKSSREGFLHGLLTGDKTGTCANTPVLYAAIGRKLGYPIYIVQARGHLFNRWHDAKTGERFNLDASGRGFNSPPDSFFYDWPKKITQAEVAHGLFLRNLDLVEELGQFMLTRGHCLEDKGHLLDAIVTYGHAHRLAPTNPHCLSFLLAALNKELDMQRLGEWPISYKQVEAWDKEVLPHRFTLDSRYGNRMNGAGLPQEQQGTQAHRE